MSDDQFKEEWLDKILSQIERHYNKLVGMSKEIEDEKGETASFIIAVLVWIKEIQSKTPKETWDLTDKAATMIWEEAKATDTTRRVYS